MKIEEIILRIILSLMMTIVIGYEREKNKSNEGIKTHAMVGVAATVISLVQSQIVQDSIKLGLTNPDILGVVRSDPARLIAQVVSGIGFLGAGTIVVIKRNISGLTTASSIWMTAALGIAIGMGYYKIAVVGLCAVVVIMHGLKQIISLTQSQKVIIKHIDDPDTYAYIKEVFDEGKYGHEVLSYDAKMCYDSRVITHVFQIELASESFYSDLVHNLSLNTSIISVQSSNI